MKHFFTVDGERQRAWLVHRDGGFALITDRETPVRLERGGGAHARLLVGDDVHDVLIAVRGDTAFVHIGGREVEVRFEAAVAVFEHEAAASGDAVARAPMPGMVLSIQVSPGQKVAVGDVLVIIESMKLETSIKAPRAGVVESIEVAAGQTFDRDAALVTLAAEE
jgi:biotin carboxyl carrier protein